MPKSVTQVDADAFVRGLESKLRLLKVRSEEQLGELGEQAVRFMREKAPRGTGRLADSIKSELRRDGRGAYVEISVEPFYASFHEFGTSRMGARPFFRPGLDMALSEGIIRFRGLLT